MSDETELGFQPAQEEGQTSETIPQEDQQEGNQQEYVTRQDFEELASRLEQSLTDKTVNRIEKKLEKWKNNLKEQGVSVTPQMLEQGRQELAIAELHQLEVEDKAAQPVQTSSQSAFTPEAKAKVHARMAQLQADLGVELTNKDEEYFDVPWFQPNPDKFLARFEEALKAKGTRTKGSTLQSNSARSPLPSGGSAARDNPIEDIIEPRELFKLAFKK